MKKENIDLSTQYKNHVHISKVQQIHMHIASVSLGGMVKAMFYVFSIPQSKTGLSQHRGILKGHIGIHIRRGKHPTIKDTCSIL